MTTPTGSRSICFTAIGAVSAAMVFTAPLAAAEPQASADKLCDFIYPTPDDFEVIANSTAIAVSNADGAVHLELHTDANSETPYEQRFSVIWANLDTGRNGSEQVTATVQGPDNVLSIPRVVTEPGRIAFVLAAANHGSDQNYTNGDCSAEYTVR
ncbi:hypothetical protein ACFVVM_07595 [Nocardia sp. NPDC058176]|uniref:hypothetical protein n=1 Tax=Nocardia sp. NPDC058176 TaxID=3346368 RepID=UPI0036DEF971